MSFYTLRYKIFERITIRLIQEQYRKELFRGGIQKENLGEFTFSRPALVLETDIGFPSVVFIKFFFLESDHDSKLPENRPQNAAQIKGVFIHQHRRSGYRNHLQRTDVHVGSG